MFFRHSQRTPRKMMHSRVADMVTKFLGIDESVRCDLHIKYSHPAHIIVGRTSSKKIRPLPADLSRFFIPADLSDQDAIKAAYRRLLKTHHPDAGGQHEAMVALNAAFARAQMVMRTLSAPLEASQEAPQTQWSTTKHVLYQMAFEQAVPPLWFGISTWAGPPGLSAFEPAEIDAWLAMLVLSIDVCDGRLNGDGAFQRFDDWLCSAPHHLRPRPGVWKDVVLARGVFDIGLHLAKAYQRARVQPVVDEVAKILRLLVPMHIMAESKFWPRSELRFRHPAFVQSQFDQMEQRVAAATRPLFRKGGK